MTPAGTRPWQANIYRRIAQVLGVVGVVPFRLLGWLPNPVSDNPLSRIALLTAKELAGANRRHLQAALRGAALSDLPDPDVLRTLDIPTLIIAWEDDIAHPMSTAEMLAETLPNVHALVVSGSNELPDWTPDIKAFLAAQKAATRP